MEIIDWGKEFLKERERERNQGPPWNLESWLAGEVNVLKMKDRGMGQANLSPS